MISRYHDDIMSKPAVNRQSPEMVPTKLLALGLSYESCLNDSGKRNWYHDIDLQPEAELDSATPCCMDAVELPDYTVEKFHTFGIFPD